MRWPAITGNRNDMPVQLALTVGAYQAESVIAEAQACVNMYGERNPQDAPFPYTYYPRPGLSWWGGSAAASLQTGGIAAEGRGIYFSTTGVLFYVIGTQLIAIDDFGTSSQGSPFLVTQLQSATGKVSMTDNGSVMIAVDGTTNITVVNLLGVISATILNSTPTYGGNFCDYVDTFLVINRPGTNQFYSSDSNMTFNTATQGPIQTASLTTGGSGYGNGTFNGVNASGGSGSGATLNITVTGGVVTSATIATPGDGYKVGDILICTDLPGVSAPGPVTALALYTVGNDGFFNPGTDSNVSMELGSGTGLVASFVVNSSGFVGTPTINNGGSGFKNGDLVTGNVPGKPGYIGKQFKVPCWWTATVNTTPGSGFTMTVNSITDDDSFNSLSFASKAGFPDDVLALIAVHRELWIFGRQTTEIWADAGNPIFPFAPESGIFLQNGIVAPYSLTKSGLTPLWLGQDQNGLAVIYQGISYEAVRISTHAIEVAIQAYATLSDAQGYVIQFNGHDMYVLNFPTEDVTWAFDLVTRLWSEWSSLGSDGNQHVFLGNWGANASGQVLVQHNTLGSLMLVQPYTYNDIGSAVTRQCGFPHHKKEMRRRFYTFFTADMEVGQPVGPQSSSLGAPCNCGSVTLDWSDDGGHTWQSGMPLNMPAGSFKQLMKWNRLGYARDRVFRLTWSADVRTALNGAWSATIDAFS